MSASDLAPFVAAVIEDGIVAEMKNKIEELESKIQTRDNERLLVQITGYNGRPIYGEKSLTAGRPIADSRDNDTLWLLDMHNGDEVFIIPLDEDSIPELEIRVGGILIMPRFSDQFGMFDYIFDHEEHQEEEDLDKLVYLDEVEFRSGAVFDPDDDCPINGISGRVGPITVWNFNQFCELQRSGLIEFPTLHLFEHIALPTTGAVTQTVAVTEIVFYKKNISGCISLMEQLGICTSAPRRS